MEKKKKKTSFGPDFGPFGPKFGPPNFFVGFTSNRYNIL